MRLLVLGGTRFVGRAVVESALARGDEVTVLNRGVSRSGIPGVDSLVADRTDPEALRSALRGHEWDAVIDTWRGAPLAVHHAVELLADRVGHYGYVSSRSVYAWPVPSGADESAPVVDGDPTDATDASYPAVKRGGELAVLAAFGERALLARAGLVIGPYENVGRLPWWLRRIERGGQVLTPGPPERPLQYIDARDLASWMLSAADRGLSGAFNSVSRPGHTTMGDLLEAAVKVTGSAAELVWTGPEVLAEAGVSPWIDLPIWLPEGSEDASMFDGDVSAAYAAGLTCRPVADTVADTWAWLQAEGDPAPAPGVPPVGLDPAREREVLRAGRRG